ncbi:unnamed protein product [Dovyalis caffra]|uniref:Uncharacterized protein n=1 Tax=Dovyalis caffra TaxID=77055 RepID=A0AAV1RSY3_9ROSI|nr:unnamed protein product [Dovyalis caffra]
MAQPFLLGIKNQTVVHGESELSAITPQLFLRYIRDQDSADFYLNASLFLPLRELRTLDLTGNRIVNCLENEEASETWHFGDSGLE